MTTAKEWVLERSLLPKTGTYTLREHFTSILASVTAELGGELVVETDIVELQVSPGNSVLEIDPVYEVPAITVVSHNITIDTISTDIVIDACS